MSNTAEVRTTWPAESLEGQIAMVDARRNLVVVKSPDGVPFDMLVNGKTRIRSGDQMLSINDLHKHQNRSVSLQFVPERRGDVAQSIRVSG